MISHFEWLQGGHCFSLDALTIKGGSWRIEQYPSSFALFKHPSEGWTLFDSGYSRHFFSASSKFPYRFYRFVTPVRLRGDETAVAQLSERSIRAQDIKTIILSHLHADHIAGIKEFPRATFVTSRSGYEALAPLRGLAATQNGFLPDLMPTDFLSRVRWVEDQPDVWGDGLVRMVPLPGHAPGQYGARLLTDSGEKFLCADACWKSRSYRDMIDLPNLTHKLLTHDTPAFRKTLEELHLLSRENPEILILPTHCSEVCR